MAITVSHVPIRIPWEWTRAWCRVEDGNEKCYMVMRYNGNQQPVPVDLTHCAVVVCLTGQASNCAVSCAVTYTETQSYLLQNTNSSSLRRVRWGGVVSRSEVYPAGTASRLLCV